MKHRYAGPAVAGLAGFRSEFRAKIDAQKLASQVGRTLARAEGAPLL